MFSRLFDPLIKPLSQLRRTHQWLGAFLFLGFVGGCTTTPPQTLELRENSPQVVARYELTNTPFFPQTENYCGPAALATVAQFHQKSALPDQIAPMIFTPGLEGTLQIEVVAAARRFDLLPVMLDGKLESLLREVEAGNPVLVLQNLGLDSYPFWHYAVVVGYDIEAQTLVLRSGTEKRLVRSFANFERTWQRAGYWGLVIVKPETIPITADAERYLAAVIEVEQTGHLVSANEAYATASKRWPDNLLALTGFGNTAFAMHNFDLSEQAFKTALDLSPNSHQLWNNLAYAQAKLGKKEASLAAINKALGLAPDNSNYQHSLTELKQLLDID